MEKFLEKCCNRVPGEFSFKAPEGNENIQRNFQWNCCRDSYETFLEKFENPWEKSYGDDAGRISWEIYGGILLKLLKETLYKFLQISLEGGIPARVTESNSARIPERIHA